MTAHQQTVVNHLRQEYARVIVLPSDVPWFFVDCFTSTGSTHPFPTKTFRISPSGFKQDVTPERVS